MKIVKKHSYLQLYRYIIFQGNEIQHVCEPRHEKTNILHIQKQAQISFVVAAKLISAFVVTTWIIQFLYFLNPKIPFCRHVIFGDLFYFFILRFYVWPYLRDMDMQLCKGLYQLSHLQKKKTKKKQNKKKHTHTQKKAISKLTLQKISVLSSNYSKAYGKINLYDCRLSHSSSFIQILSDHLEVNLTTLITEKRQYIFSGLVTITPQTEAFTHLDMKLNIYL